MKQLQPIKEITPEILEEIEQSEHIFPMILEGLYCRISRHVDDEGDIDNSFPYRLDIGSYVDGVFTLSEELDPWGFPVASHVCEILTGESRIDSILVSIGATLLAVLRAREGKNTYVFKTPFDRGRTLEYDQSKDTFKVLGSEGELIYLAKDEFTDDVGKVLIGMNGNLTYYFELFQQVGQCLENSIIRMLINEREKEPEVDLLLREAIAFGKALGGDEDFFIKIGHTDLVYDSSDKSYGFRGRFYELPEDASEEEIAEQAKKEEYLRKQRQKLRLKGSESLMEKMATYTIYKRRDVLNALYK